MQFVAKPPEMAQYGALSVGPIELHGLVSTTETGLDQRLQHLQCQRFDPFTQRETPHAWKLVKQWNKPRQPVITGLYRGWNLFRLTLYSLEFPSPEGCAPWTPIFPPRRRRRQARVCEREETYPALVCPPSAPAALCGITKGDVA